MKTARLMSGMVAVVGLFGAANVATAGDWSGSFHLNNGGGFSSGGCGPGGLSINGSYRGSRWSVDYSVNSGWSGWSGDCGPSGSGRVVGGFTYIGNGYATDFYPRYGSYYDRWFWDRYGYRYRPYGWATGVVEQRGGGPVDWSLLPGVAPQPAPVGQPDAPPPPPPTKLELAQAAAAEKRFDDARALFGEHLAANPEDTAVSRQLAMMLIESRDLDSGLAMLRDLYVKDPGLVEAVYAGEGVAQSSSRLRDMLVRVTSHAHKVKSPSAWLGVVVLMQAEGRKAPALKMLDRAKDAGLERPLVERFTAALAPTPIVKAPIVKAKPTSPSAIPATPVPAPAAPAPGSANVGEATNADPMGR